MSKNSSTFVKWFVELCAYIILNVSSNVQIQRNLESQERSRQTWLKVLWIKLKNTTSYLSQFCLSRIRETFIGNHFCLAIKTTTPISPHYFMTSSKWPLLLSLFWLQQKWRTLRLNGVCWWCVYITRSIVRLFVMGFTESDLQLDDFNAIIPTAAIRFNIPLTCCEYL